MNKLLLTIFALLFLRVSIACDYSIPTNVQYRAVTDPTPPAGFPSTYYEVVFTLNVGAGESSADDYTNAVNIVFPKGYTGTILDYTVNDVAGASLSVDPNSSDSNLESASGSIQAATSTSGPYVRFRNSVISKYFTDPTASGDIDAYEVQSYQIKIRFSHPIPTGQYIIVEGMEAQGAYVTPDDYARVPVNNPGAYSGTYGSLTSTGYPFNGSPTTFGTNCMTNCTGSGNPPRSFHCTYSLGVAPGCTTPLSSSSCPDLAMPAPTPATSSLPIQLAFFGLNTIDNKEIKLTWKTASELNTDKFEIERSIDSKEWIKIGEVDATGSSSTLKSYNFIDNKPVAGNNYYRIKTLDIDGTYEYTSSIMGKLNKKSITLFNSLIQKSQNLIAVLDSQTDDKVNIIIYGANGEQVYFKSVNVVTGINKIELDVNNFTSGIYTITDGKGFQKFSIQ